MTPDGLEFYNHGLQKKTHDHGIPENPDMPDELKKALAKNKAAQKNFELFPPSAKRMFYRWILSAKTDETKLKRIEKVIKNAEENKKKF